jgi:hypothetical protein
MTPNYAEVLSAFFDGEPVDPEALATSLQEPDAIEFLVEFARLRRAVYEDTSRPTEEFCETMRERLARAESQRRSRHRLGQFSLAASLALAAAAGGFGVRAVLERQPPAVGVPWRATQTTGRPSAAGGQPVSVPIAAPPESVRAKPGIPSALLRMRFLEWQEKVL